MTQADERARLISLDAEHVLAQEAHGPGRLHHLGERHRPVPGTLQGIPRCQPGRQRPVDLPAIEPGEEQLERRAIGWPEPERSLQSILGERLEPPLHAPDRLEVRTGDDPIRVSLGLLPVVELSADDLDQRQDAVLVLGPQA